MYKNILALSLVLVLGAACETQAGQMDSPLAPPSSDSNAEAPDELEFNYSIKQNPSTEKYELLSGTFVVEEDLEDFLKANYPEVELWFEREDSEYHYIYFRSVAGCGGCAFYEPKYVAIHKETGTLSVATLKAKGSYSEFTLFRQGVPPMVLSSEGDKAAYIMNPEGPEANIEAGSPTAIYVYDFVTEEVSKVEDVEVGEDWLNLEYIPFLTEEGEKGLNSVF